MWTVLQSLIVQAALAVLQAVLAKHPNATAEEKKVIADVAQVATQADTAVNGASWSYTAPPAAPAAAA